MGKLCLPVSARKGFPELMGGEGRRSAVGLRVVALAYGAPGDDLLQEGLRPGVRYTWACRNQSRGRDPAGNRSQKDERDSFCELSGRTDFPWRDTSVLVAPPVL